MTKEGEIQQAYDKWAATYDQDVNRTRDLDKSITREALKNQSYHHILELGSGTGKNSSFYAASARDVTALDFSLSMIRKARDSYSWKNVRLLVADLNKPLPFKNSRFDFVAANLVLEHIDNLSFVFSEVFRCLDVGGVFFISELHPYMQYEGTAANFSVNDEEIRIEAFVHHLKDYTQTAKNVGFRINDINEWWVPDSSPGDPPRLITLRYVK